MLQFAPYCDYLRPARDQPPISHTHKRTPTGAAYVLIFLGAAPLIIALALLLQILWLPLAALVMIIRASRHRRCRPNVLIYPLTAAAMILDIDGD